MVGTYLLEDKNNDSDEDSQQIRSGSLILYEIRDGNTLYIHLLYSQRQRNLMYSVIASKQNQQSLHVSTWPGALTYRTF